MDLGLYTSKHNNKHMRLTMSNYCPSIAMPEDRKDAEVKRPYDVPVRPESVIDLNFKRTCSEKVVGLVAMARMSNSLGKTFILKRQYKYALEALISSKVSFVLEEEETTSLKQSMH